jgi:uncharacterized repeat protein (TIGR03803 family)
LISFNGTNGNEPGFGNLVSDANGDLFGTTYGGGTLGGGTVFEVVRTGDSYAAAPTILVNFDYADGAYPLSGLIIDGSGNLFGTTSSGGSFGYGTVFEIANTANGYANAPTTLVSFNVADGAFPESTLVVDADGNLIGTAFSGGVGGGTVFEITKMASGYANAPTTLVAFDAGNGGPLGGLVADTNGNLYGTTLFGGASGYGTVFEITKTSGGYDPAPITLVSFNGANGKYPYSALITDAQGNLFGTTRLGGTSGYGTVFEIVKTTSGYSATPTTLANFDGSVGAFPRGVLIADANGNLFGTTEAGGDPGSNGTVFEITNTSSGYASTLTPVINFEGFNGAKPYSGLIADLNGNLFGTTFSGGSFSDGTVFEVSGGGFVPPKVFAGTPGSSNCAGKSLSMLAQTYGGTSYAAANLGYASVANLQSAVRSYCGQ